MKLDDKLIRDGQDDDIVLTESPEEVNQFDFGVWPEIVGLIGTLAIIWWMFQ
ncbi:hypothetical protein [Salinicola rhizosphaerae]|uniref:Uncharacterized protein n=1 Tax=Salinicola rhizosphaerae TaxID=1443141 RepID=A0ABQ3E383_9GAMM|nr:hypothetical protein [Salinicola rhizosphaerae]GHB21988.1 hypothetical protein GCM10009038_21130 [Salinicola rhizosphaerae]